jgi:hypothetical protein
METLAERELKLLSCGTTWVMSVTAPASVTEAPASWSRSQPPDGWETLRAEMRRSRCAPPADPAAARLENLGYID